LDEVALRALSLEQILKQGADPHSALQDLQQVLAIALDSIARYAPPESQESAASPMNHSQIAECLRRLLAAWHSDSSSNVESVLAECGHTLPAQSRELLQTALLNYDFRAGEATTTALMQSLNASREES
jgi:hypothetical protein